MKKYLVLCIAAILVFMQILLFRAKDEPSTPTSGIYRLHIIANSNSNTDQSVKFEIRDAILSYEQKLFSENENITTAADTKQLIMKNAHEINDIAYSVLEKNGLDYGVKISTGTYDFPDKTYAGKLYPAGEYDALRVVLGDGKGENWWCVMFPPLCITDDAMGKSEHKEAAGGTDNAVEFRSIFSTIGKWFVGLFD